MSLSSLVRMGETVHDFEVPHLEVVAVNGLGGGGDASCGFGKRKKTIWVHRAEAQDGVAGVS